MSTNNIKSKAVRLGALVLASGAALLATGCNNNSVDNLFFTVKSPDGTLEVTFCDRAASIYSIIYNSTDVTYHPQNKTDFVNKGYYGKCLGRVAGRIPDGNLRVGYKEYQLDINETKEVPGGRKNNCLHGGTNGLASKDFTHTIVEKKNYTEVTFKYLSVAGEAGFPEALNVRYTYKVWSEITEGEGEEVETHNDLELTIDAGSSGLTPVNLSIHPFFRLSGNNTYLYGNEKDKEGTPHNMYIKASKLAKYDDEGHQTVEGLRDINENEPWDFNDTTNNGKGITLDTLNKAKNADPVSGGFDNIWYFGTAEDGEDAKIGDGDFVLKGSKATLKVTSDADAIIMYSNCYPETGLKMNNGEDDDYFKAITVEPYKFFTTEQKSIDKLLIKPEESFSRHITYTFSDVE